MAWQCGELENAIERAVVLCPIDTITLNYLPGHLKQLKEKEDACDEFNLTEVEKGYSSGH